MLLVELSVKQLREQLEECELDVSGSKKVLQARLEEVLRKIGDDPETFHFKSAEEAILSKFETVSKKMVDETSRKFESVFQKIDENLERTTRNLKKFVDRTTRNLKVFLM